MTAEGPKILLIEDEQEIRRFLRVSLGGQGYRLVESASGRDGVMQAASQQPDLMILDIMLPKMNGYEVLGRLKHDVRTASIPVIVLTAKEKGEVKKEFAELGDIPVIGKTGGFEKLGQLVRELL